MAPFHLTACQGIKPGTVLTDIRKEEVEGAHVVVVTELYIKGLSAL